MTTRRMYFATAALSALALGVAIAGGWGQDFPDGDRPTGTKPGTTTGTARVEANVQHADVAPPTVGPAGDIIWS
ncbi:hypothetical protein [Streptomyces sp. NPDC002104]